MGFIKKALNLGRVALASFLIVAIVMEQQAGATQSGNATIYKSEDVETGTVVVSQTSSTNGLICGACYNIKGIGGAERCKPGSSVVTVIEFYIPNSTSNDNGSWSNPPQHILMSPSDYLKIFYNDDVTALANYSRCRCVVDGGIELKLINHLNYTEILITNVGGAGDLISVFVKGSKTDWLRMSSDQCQFWKIAFNLVGQSLSLHLINSSNTSLVFYNLIPADWESNNKYSTPNNFGP